MQLERYYKAMKRPSVGSFFVIDIEKEDLPTTIWKLVHFAAGHMHITAATTALRLLIGSVETRFENSRRRSTVLLTLGVRLRPRKE